MAIKEEGAHCASHGASNYAYDSIFDLVAQIEGNLLRVDMDNYLVTTTSRVGNTNLVPTTHS